MKVDEAIRVAKIDTEERLCGNLGVMFGTTAVHTLIEEVERLRIVRKKAHEHVLELRDAWEHGAIHERDGLGGLRSNRNAEVEVALREAAEAAGPGLKE